MKKSWLILLFLFSLSLVPAAVRTCTLDCADNSNDVSLVSNFQDSATNLQTCVIQDPKNSPYYYSMSCPSNPPYSGDSFDSFSENICIIQSQNTFSDEGRFLAYCPNVGYENRCPKWPTVDGQNCTIVGSVPIGVNYFSNCNSKTYVCSKPVGASRAEWALVDSCSSIPESCNGYDDNCNDQVDEGDICSCVDGANYGTITSAGGYWATACCTLVNGNCGTHIPGSSCWGCPPPYGNDPAGYVGKCVQSVWVSTGSTINYFCPGSGCTKPCSPNSAAGCLSSCYSLNKTMWSSLNSLNQIDQAQSGDTVLMIYGGQNLEGKTINYQVQNYTSGFVWYNPSTWFGSKVWASSPKISGDAYEPWVVQGEDNGKLRFNATINGTNIGNISNNLTINNTGSNLNSGPVAVISNPVNNNRYKLNTNISFTQASYDEDDLLKITWDFGDGGSYVVNNYAKAINSSAANKNYSYNKIGIYNVKLTAKEMNRNQEDSQNINITILREGINVIPIISSPPNSAVFGNGSVYFNANQSFIVNCSLLNNMIGATFNTSDNLLSCKYVFEPGSIPSDSLKIYLNWSFGDGKYKAGYWNDTSHINLTSFTHAYLTGGEHRVSLNMKFNWTG